MWFEIGIHQEYFIRFMFYNVAEIFRKWLPNAHCWWFASNPKHCDSMDDKRRTTNDERCVISLFEQIANYNTIDMSGIDSNVHHCTTISRYTYVHNTQLSKQFFKSKKYETFPMSWQMALQQNTNPIYDWLWCSAEIRAKNTSLSNITSRARVLSLEWTGHCIEYEGFFFSSVNVLLQIARVCGKQTIEFKWIDNQFE